MRVQLLIDYRLSSTPYHAHPMQPGTMPALVPWAVCDPAPNPKSDSTTTVLDAHIQTLTAAQSKVEIAPVKAVFESTIAILTLVRVMGSVLFLFLHLLNSAMPRTR